MFGTPTELGFIPRTAYRIIDEMNADLMRSQWQWKATCSAIEVYKDEVFDLLRDSSDGVSSTGTKIIILSVNAQSELDELTNKDVCPKTAPNVITMAVRTSVEKRSKTGLQSFAEKDIKAIADIDEIIHEAKANRIMKPTSMNDQSSRSHVILTLLIDRWHKPSGQLQRSKVQLVDLAGSERLSRIGTDHIKESIATNKSLSVLNKCIKVRNYSLISFFCLLLS